MKDLKITATVEVIRCVKNPNLGREYDGRKDDKPYIIFFKKQKIRKVGEESYPMSIDDTCKSRVELKSGSHRVEIITWKKGDDKYAETGYTILALVKDQGKGASQWVQSLEYCFKTGRLWQLPQFLLSYLGQSKF